MVAVPASAYKFELLGLLLREVPLWRGFFASRHKFRKLRVGSQAFGVAEPYDVSIRPVKQCVFPTERLGGRAHPTGMNSQLDGEIE